MSERVAAVLLDVDGTLLTEAGAIPGAAATVDGLRRRGVPFRVVTNITRRPRREVAGRLAEHGIAIERDELLTAVIAGALWLSARGIRRVAPFVAPDTLEDLADFELSGGVAGSARSEAPEAVVVGDLGDGWSHRLLNEAFRYVMDGARLLALQRGRYWQGPTGLEVDAGAYVAALEYAAGTKAVVCGKPNPEFFRSAVASLGSVVPVVGDRPIAMVGDDLWSDIQGAQAAGLEGWLVRTGKYRADELERSDIRPDRVLDSVADLGTTGA